MLKITRLTKGRGKSSLAKKSNSKQKFTKKLIKVILITFLMITLISPKSLDSKISNEKDLVIISEAGSIFNLANRGEIQMLDLILEMEISNYINKYSPSSELSPKKFIEICIEYDFDIVLAMSQAHVESHFGTKGIASRTNSVFNVGTYDDGTILYRYMDPNLSIAPYVDLMIRNYLIHHQKSAEDLLKPKAFVNFEGKRYASFKFYEERVKFIYDHINETTNIASLYDKRNSKRIKNSVAYYKELDSFFEKLTQS